MKRIRTESAPSWLSLLPDKSHRIKNRRDKQRSRMNLFIQSGLFFGMVTRTHQRSGFHHRKTEFKTDSFPVFELFRRYPAVNGQMLACGLEVLPKRENVHIFPANILQGLEHFLVSFADAQHQAGFSRKTLFFRAIEKFE